MLEKCPLVFWSMQCDQSLLVVMRLLTRDDVMRRGDCLSTRLIVHMVVTDYDAI